MGRSLTGGTFSVSGYSAKIRNAESVLLETKGSMSSQDRSDRDRATATIEIITPKLTFHERRVTNAGAQLRTWKKRLTEFDRERYSKLKKEDVRRSSLVATTAHIKVSPWGV
jgi:hypothetical protein